MWARAGLLLVWARARVVRSYTTTELLHLERVRLWDGQWVGDCCDSSCLGEVHLAWVGRVVE